VERALSDAGSPAVMKGEHHSNIFCVAFNNSNTKIFSGGEPSLLCCNHIPSVIFLSAIFVSLLTLLPFHLLDLLYLLQEMMNKFWFMMWRGNMFYQSLKIAIHYILHFWATVCKTVRPMLSDRRVSVCPVLSVTLVYCGQMV